MSNRGASSFDPPQLVRRSRGYVPLAVRLPMAAARPC
jgi:hypothetical protein